MNEDIERLKLTIYRLIGENNGLRFVVGLRRRTMNCVAMNCNSKEMYNTGYKNWQESGLIRLY